MSNEYVQCTEAGVVVSVLVSLSAINKKNALIFCKHNCIGIHHGSRILNVHDIIKERTKQTS